MAQPSVHLEHALLSVADLSRSLEFYRKLLPEWTIRWEGANDKSGRWVHFGPEGESRPGYLSIYELPGAASSGEGYLSRVRIEHLGFSHPDVEALEAELAGRGLKPSDRAGDEAYRRLYYTDPDGHDLELVQKL